MSPTTFQNAPPPLMTDYDHNMIYVICAQLYGLIITSSISTTYKISYFDCHSLHFLEITKVVSIVPRLTPSAVTLLILTYRTRSYCTRCCLLPVTRAFSTISWRRAITLACSKLCSRPTGCATHCPRLPLAPFSFN